MQQSCVPATTPQISGLGSDLIQHSDGTVYISYAEVEPSTSEVTYRLAKCSGLDCSYPTIFTLGSPQHYDSSTSSIAIAIVQSSKAPSNVVVAASFGTTTQGIANCSSVNYNAPTPFSGVIDNAGVSGFGSHVAISKTQNSRIILAYSLSQMTVGVTTCDDSDSCSPAVNFCDLGQPFYGLPNMTSAAIDMIQFPLTGNGIVAFQTTPTQLMVASCSGVFDCCSLPVTFSSTLTGTSPSMVVTNIITQQFILAGCLPTGGVQLYRCSFGIGCVPDSTYNVARPCQDLTLLLPFDLLMIYSTGNEIVLVSTTNPPSTSLAVTKTLTTSTGELKYVKAIQSTILGFPAGLLVSYFDSATNQLKLISCLDLLCATSTITVVAPITGLQTTVMEVSSLPVITFHDNSKGVPAALYCTDIYCGSSQYRKIGALSNPSGRYIASSPLPNGFRTVYQNEYNPSTIEITDCWNSSCIAPTSYGKPANSLSIRTQVNSPPYDTLVVVGNIAYTPYFCSGATSCSGLFFIHDA
eukprot:TRINITY_DN11111_c0_g2_i1.p1 TRINITY_DN11111_c0_g2~~TRINITY_DN11111_c0_g2_i1.p1  ORF type:complete len:523 (+),score=52.25 TRINITY_DN11111_c0_g2_i1:267-1835(+)